MNQEERTMVDAEDQVVGRLASEVAKIVNQGQDVTVINANRALISGRKEEVVSKYRKRKKIGNKYKGPFYPNNAAGILKRTISGMLSDNKSQTGSLRIENGEREESGQDFIRFEDAEKSNLKKKKYIYLEELASDLSKKE